MLPGSKTRKMIKKGLWMGGWLLNKSFCFSQARNVSSIKRCLQRQLRASERKKRDKWWRLLLLLTKIFKSHVEIIS